MMCTHLKAQRLDDQNRLRMKLDILQMKKEICLLKNITFHCEFEDLFSKKKKSHAPKKRQPFFFGRRQRTFFRSFKISTSGKREIVTLIFFLGGV